MSEISTAPKTKLTISPCTVEVNGSVTVDKSKFEVMLNPSAYSRKYSIAYNKGKTLGQVGPPLQFSAINAEVVSFDIVLDGTGAIPGRVPDVQTQLQQLQQIVYNYDGDDHQPNHVRILWGSLIFFGRMQSMTVDHTLFRAGGEPLRAKVKLSFASFMSGREEALRSNRRSPDLTRQVVFKAGDTLPLLCYRIYKDCDYYLDVARYNDLDSVLDIKPGTTLRFPPLR